MQNPLSGATLPDIIQRYQNAHDQRDLVGALETFSPAAVVVDDGHTSSGHEEIRHWLGTTSSEFTYTRTLLRVATAGPDEWIVTNNITGNFPGGTVDLAYRFTVKDGLIQHLVIGVDG